MNTDQQDAIRAVTDGLPTVSYVADNSGRPTLTPGFVWQPVAEANRQAWEEIERRVAASRAQAIAGRVSCLHYYMTANQMDAGLLAAYTGQSRWRVWLHLRPWGFRRLGRETLEIYAQLFQVGALDLLHGRLLPPVFDQHRAAPSPQAPPP